MTINTQGGESTEGTDQMAEEQEAKPSTEHHLLVEFIFEHQTWLIKFLGRRKYRRVLFTPVLKWIGVLRSARHQYLIQGIHAIYGVRIKNIGSTDFPGGSMSNLSIKHESSKVAIQGRDTKPIQTLAPGEFTNIWVVNTIFNIPGPIWVSCKVTPSVGTIHTYQRSRGEDNEFRLDTVNNWSHSDYVLPHMDHLQSRTNMLILILTTVTLIEALIGFRAIGNSLWQSIHELSEVGRNFIVFVSEKL